jgi:hypothetical protein
VGHAQFFGKNALDFLSRHGRSYFN